MNDEKQQTQSAQNSTQSESAAAKALLAETVAKLESVIQDTQNQPRIRSTKMNLIKSEYLKKKYNVEIKLQQQNQQMH